MRFARGAFFCVKQKHHLPRGKVVKKKLWETGSQNKYSDYYSIFILSVTT